MYRFLILSLLLLIFISCSETKTTVSQTPAVISENDSENSFAYRFTNAYNTYNYADMRGILCDTVKLYANGFLVVDSRNSFIELMEWGEQLEGVNKIVNVLHESEDSVVYIEEQLNLKYLLLFDSIPFVSRTSLKVVSNKIIEINSIAVDMNQLSINNEKHRKFRQWAENEMPEQSEKMFYPFNKHSAKILLDALYLYSNE